MPHSAKQQTPAERETYWSSIILEWEASGLTRSRFCKNKKINHSTFYNWQKKLRHLVALHSKTSPKKDCEHSADKKPSFIPIKVTPSKKRLTIKNLDQRLTIKLPNGIEILVPQNGKMSLIDHVKNLKEI